MTLKTVERGAALLDERLPGWEDEIDLARLDLASTCDCIVGQLTPPQRGRSRYLRGLAMLEVGDGRDYGFDVDYYGRGAKTYESLTSAWRRLIKRRKRGRA